MISEGEHGADDRSTGQNIGAETVPDPPREFILPPEWGTEDPRPLQDLITHIVLAEVADFEQRQEARRFVRHLSPEEIHTGAAHGRVDPGGRLASEPVDPQAAVETALLAFEDGLYYIFVDGTQITGLDDPVTLRDESQLTFVRLVPLAGG